MIKLKAYAKVNLRLDITGRREDGYHELRTVMQTIDLFDVLTFEKTDEKGILIETENEELSVGEDNLIYKACDMLMREFDIKNGVKVTLEKNIPIAAGMAGGSSDCAAALKGMNELFSLGLSMDELRKRGIRLGADVPYCIMGGTVLAEGIGDVLTPLKAAPACTYLVVKPPFAVSTKEVYERFDDEKEYGSPSDGIEKILRAIDEDNLDMLTDGMGNDLEKVTVAMHPEIREIKDIMMHGGALRALMSGSGPTVFGIYDNLEKVWQTALLIEERLHAAEVFIVGGI